VKFFLGVDGGQSSTTALIGDENGRILGVGRAGPCNHAGAAEGREKFVQALSACVGDALAQASEAVPATEATASAIQFECACLGFSGGPADKEALAREIVDAKHYAFTHDALIALSGATAGGHGVVSIAGTGSIAFGRNSVGRTARAGGWGYTFGDEGGAFDLVRKAVRAALRFEEGWGPPTALRDALLDAAGAGPTQLRRDSTERSPLELRRDSMERSPLELRRDGAPSGSERSPSDFGRDSMERSSSHGYPGRDADGAGSINDLLHRLYTDEFPRARIAAFAPLVDEVALAGDAVARDILNGAAQSLATIAAAVREQLFAPGEIVTVSYAGGAFRSAMLLERFRLLVELADGNRVTAPRFGPAAGALIEAYRLAGIECALDRLPAF
jgi:N-acetylglucosamine kinase-like BadF-type ATPase